MKKILTLLLVLLLSLTVMVGCDKIPGVGEFFDKIGLPGLNPNDQPDQPDQPDTPEVDADLKAAYDYVHQMVKGIPTETVAGYSLPLKASIGSKTYNVKWEIIGTDAVVINGDKVTVTGSEEAAINYTLKFTVTNEKGESLSREYNKVVPQIKFEGGVVDPVVGTAYKFGMVQGNLDNTIYYITGAMDGYYMATTTDMALGADVYLETADGGYYMYCMVGETKSYINMVQKDAYVNAKFEATPSTVYTYNSTSKTVIAVVADAEYWHGTRNDNTYTTLGPCKVEYAGFYGQFYAIPDDLEHVHDFQNGKCTTCGEKDPDYVVDLEYPVVNELHDGDVVIIGAPAYDMVLSTNKTGNYNLGVDYTNGFSGITNAELFVVTVNADGTYTFTSKSGLVLALGDSYQSLDPLGTYNTWTLTAKEGAEGIFYVNTVRNDKNEYIEWYASKGNWSTYHPDALDNCYELSFYLVDTGAEICKHENTTETVVNPTCGEDGSKTVVCSDCGATVSTEKLNATGEHTYVDGVCSVCGKNEPAAGSNVADFDSFTKGDGKDTSYVDRTNADGWQMTGGRCDEQEAFGSDPQIILNGKTSALGTLKSCLLTGGIKSLSFNYGYAFTESNGVSLKINILDKDGNVVATTDCINTSLEKLVAAEFVWNLPTPVVGEFYIQIINNAPTGQDGNKDRYSLWNLTWTNPTGDEPVCEHANTTETVVDPTCGEDGSKSVVCSDCGATISTEKLPATGAHNYADGTCTVCGAKDPDYVDPNAPVIVDPVVGTAYKLGMINPLKDNNVYYISGGMASTYYLATSSDLSAALDVYLETADGGYYLYVVDASGAKLYINFTVNDTHVNAVYASAPETVFTYDTELRTVVTVINNLTYALGTRSDKNYVTVGPVDVSRGSCICNFYGEAQQGGDTPECEHEYTSTSTAPTCTDAGVITYTCTKCNASYTAEGDPATGHSFADGVCTVCGEKDPDYVDPNAPAGGSADFDTIVTSNPNGSSSYTGPYTTTDGWAIENSAIQAGGATDMNPQFTVIGPDNTYKAPCLNGKVSAPGKITSPTLTGGISKITLVYTKMFTDTKLSVTITVTDLATGTAQSTVLSVELPKDEKYQKYTFEWTLDTAISGDFTIEVLNNAPSGSTSNKDRITILDLAWVNAAEGSDPVEPSCEHEYMYACDAHCMKCGELTNPDAAHTVEHVDAVEATCTTPGNVEYWVCSECGTCWTDEALTQQTNRMSVITTKDHELEENTFWHPEMVSATCTTPGVAVFECINCDYYETREAPVNPDEHDFLSFECVVEVIVPVNCATKTNGHEIVHCAYGCGATQEREVEYSFSHNWDVQKEVPATCTVDGEYYAVCTLCGEVESYVTEAGGHYNYYLTCGDSGECMECGEQFTLEHAGTPATCTEPMYCYNCWSSVGDPLGHKFESGVCTVCGEVDPDYVCEHEYMYACDAHCMKCGELTNPNATHTVSFVAAVEATCTANGNVEYWACSDCGTCWTDEALTQQTNRMSVLTFKDHEYFYACDPVCMNCYEITNPNATHNLTFTEAKAATCYEDGNVAYYGCDLCGGCWDNENATGMPLNRMMIIVPAVGHINLQHFEAIAPGCHYEGNVEYWHCYACETVWTDEDLTLVSNVKNVTLPELGGDVIHVDAKAATCTEDGNVEYWYCETCEKVWQDEARTQLTNFKNVIIGAAHSYTYECDAHCNVCYELTNPDAAHQIIFVEAKAATCTVNGNVAYYACEYCGTCWADEELTQQTNRMNVTISAPGHVDGNEDYKCDACSTKMLPADGEALTIAQALTIAKLMGNTYTTEKYYITGYIISIASTTYGNMTIRDANGDDLYLYGLYSYDGKIRYDAMSYKPVKGDEITVYTVLGCYNNSPQGKSAWMDEVVQHTEHTYADATCTSPKTCIYCGATEGEPLEHVYVDGSCQYCGKVEGDESLVNAKLDFSDKSNRTSMTTSQQVWEQNGVKLTNDKASSTSNVADYANPARFYKSSKITIEGTGMTKIVFTCNSSSYANALKSSITAGDYTVTLSGSTVTVVFNAPVDSFVIASLSGGQVRINSLVVNP